MGTAPNTFQPMSIVAKCSPISATAEHLFMPVTIVITETVHEKRRCDKGEDNDDDEFLFFFSTRFK